MHITQYNWTIVLQFHYINVANYCRMIIYQYLLVAKAYSVKDEFFSFNICGKENNGSSRDYMNTWRWIWFIFRLYTWSMTSWNTHIDYRSKWNPFVMQNSHWYAKIRDSFGRLGGRKGSCDSPAREKTRISHKDDFECNIF